MMETAFSCADAAAANLAVEQERSLPSGRSVVLKVNGSREELEVRSPGGDVEVRIVLTEAGPVVSLRGARLELETPETVAINCRQFTVQTTEGTQIQSGGDLELSGRELRVKTEGDIRMNGGIIRLNC